MPQHRLTGVFTAAELRRRLPKRADRRAVVVADFLNAALGAGGTWFATPDGGTCIIKNGRAFILRFHAGEGRPSDTAAEASVRLESAGARVATVRDLAELTTTLIAWNLSRRPAIMA